MPDIAEPAADSGAEEQVVDKGAAAAPDKGAVVDKAPVAPVKETTTPEEVAKVLKSSGMKLPDTPKAEEKAEEVVKDEEKVVEDATKGDEPETEEETEEQPAEEDKVEQPAAGEREFSLTVTDAEGNEFKVNAGDNLEEVLKDWVPKSNGQLFQMLRDVAKLEDAKAAYEAEQATATETAEKAERVREYQNSWNDEIKALQAEKRIPLTVKGEDNARVAEVYKFMADENSKRIAAGRQTLNSFEDALDKLENIEGRTAKVEADKKEREDARSNGALVGGSSAPATSSSPVYKSGSARNANEAIRALGLLK